MTTDAHSSTVSTGRGTALDQITSTDVAQAGADLLVVPIGATEQHGPHLPLSTDTDIATALAGALATRLDRVILAPPLAYGASDEHLAFPGTLSIGTGPMTQLLLALGRSADHSWSRILFLNAHGGNFDALREAITSLRDEGIDARAWSPTWDDAQDADHADSHAGNTETSVMLALRPDVVRMERAAPGTCAPLSTLIKRMQAEGVGAVSESGVLGDPSAASATVGEALLARATADLVEFVRAWRQVPTKPLPTKQLPTKPHSTELLPTKPAPTQPSDEPLQTPEETEWTPQAAK